MTEQNKSKLEHERGSEIARLFNSVIGAASIAAIFELGLFDELQQNKVIHVKAFCNEHKLHQKSISILLETLHLYKIIIYSPEDDLVSPGPIFADTLKNKGYFLWLIQGYGNMLQNISTLVKNKNRTGDLIQRNGKAIATAGRDYGMHFVDSIFNDVLSQMPFNFVADFGCGSGERLINLAKSRPDFHGVGIDIDLDAAILAQNSIANANLQDRVTVLHGDITNLKLPMFSKVDVIYSFFMAHEFWPRENCLQILRNIRAKFPNVKRFLLSDTYRSDLPLCREKPIFTLGFELTHAIMGQYIPSIQEWKDVFEEAGWLCAEQYDLKIPFSCIFDLRPGKEPSDKDD